MTIMRGPGQAECPTRRDRVSRKQGSIPCPRTMRRSKPGWARQHNEIVFCDRRDAIMPSPCRGRRPSIHEVGVAVATWSVVRIHTYALGGVTIRRTGGLDSRSPVLQSLSFFSGRGVKSCWFTCAVCIRRPGHEHKTLLGVLARGCCAQERG